MADSPSDPGGDDPREAEAERQPTAGAPRWVKAFGIVVAVVLALFLALQFVVGGEHGPGRHTSPRDASTPTSAISQGPPPSGAGHPSPSDAAAATSAMHEGPSRFGAGDP